MSDPNAGVPDANVTYGADVRLRASLFEVVVAELDRLERLYGGDRKDGRHAALALVVSWHAPQPTPPLTSCSTCWDHLDDYSQQMGAEAFPCDQLRAIAKALGIEVSDGG